MEILQKIDWNKLKFEYGLFGKRLLPWQGLTVPFEGAYCVVKASSVSARHINEPLGEEELFIAISGRALVKLGNEEFEMNAGDVMFVPAGEMHHIENNHEEDFHLYALWWNTATASGYLSAKHHEKANAQ